MRNKLLYFFIALFSLSLLTACSEDAPKKKKKARAKTTAAKSKPKTSEAAAPDESAIPKEQLEKAKAILAAVSDDAVAAVDGKKIYKINCTVCHGFKGDMKMNGAKDLRKLKTSMVERVAQIYFGKGLMTPFNGILKDEEIVSVAKYIETLKNLK